MSGPAGYLLLAVTIVTVTVCGLLQLAERRRRMAMAAALHEVRQALTSARLMVDVLPSLGETGADALAAAGEELARAYAALSAYERRLHAPVAGVRRKAAATGARPRQRPPVDALSEFERLALIWGQAARALGRELVFEWEGPAVAVSGPRRHLVEAAANLLSNAVRHGEGDIRVTARHRDGVLRVEVVDQGPGLPLPVAALVARRRLSMRRLRPHGHGLAVAVRAAERLGGRVAGGPSSAGALLVLELPVVRGWVAEAVPDDEASRVVEMPVGHNGDET